MRLFTEGELITAFHNKPLQGREVAPPLVKGAQYVVKNITFDKQGNQHLDVGLKSKYNYITSLETGEELVDGDKIHWCHPSRFIEHS